jgi:hypothetical protein
MRSWHTVTRIKAKAAAVVATGKRKLARVASVVAMAAMRIVAKMAAQSRPVVPVAAVARKKHKRFFGQILIPKSAKKPVHLMCRWTGFFADEQVNRDGFRHLGSGSGYGKLS